uniref:Initiator protein NS1 n=1 Tax=Tasmanian devil-associated bocavirus 1 TaxID=2529488 RepID=A0A481W7U3_9VIRU|nr:NS1 [Tasmanian devil-associated bocavirus 1]
MLRCLSNSQHTWVPLVLDNLQKMRRGEISEWWDILKYKTKRGDLHASQIDPKSFITNYLLCKNWKPTANADHRLITGDLDYFAASGPKTYGASIINGTFLSPITRKALWERLQPSTPAPNNPIFSGHCFANLPSVSTQTMSKKLSKKEKLMLDCLQRCDSDYITTYEDLVEKHGELVIQFEATPGGSNLLQQVLHMSNIRVQQSHNAFSYMCGRLPAQPITPKNKLMYLLSYQGYNPIQAGHWFACWLQKSTGKRNTVLFYGPASTGKTNAAKAIAEAVKLYGCVNHTNKQFPFNDCPNKLLCWWEECQMSTEFVEQAKCILGGTAFRVDRKHRDSILLPQIPCLISSNNNIYEVVSGNSVLGVHAQPLKDRVTQFNFLKKLPQDFGEISPQEVSDLIQYCAGKFTCTLEGYCEQWNIKDCKNTFPLAAYCPGHTLQDYTLESQDDYQNCPTCGNFYPLVVSESAWNQPEYWEGMDIDSISVESTPTKLSDVHSFPNTPNSIPAPQGEPAQPAPKKRRLSFSEVSDFLSEIEHVYETGLETHGWEQQTPGGTTSQETQNSEPDNERPSCSWQQ